MLHCYNCGNDLPDNLIYCTRCGKRLDAPETPTQVMGGTAAAVTTPFQAGATTPVITTRKRGGAFKAVVIALVSLFIIGAVVIVAGIMFWSFSKRQNSVTVNANLAANRTPSNTSNPAEVNVNAMAMNTNAIIDNAMKEIQKAANDALAAANKASNISIPSGKALDDGNNRIIFRPGAVSATSAGTVNEEATFVLRAAKAGQVLTGRITSPGGCIKFEDQEPSLTLATEAGDNYLTVVNSCGKPTSMVLSVTVK